MWLAGGSNACGTLKIEFHICPYQVGDINGSMAVCMCFDTPEHMACPFVLLHFLISHWLFGWVQCALYTHNTDSCCRTSCGSVLFFFIIVWFCCDNVIPTHGVFVFLFFQFLFKALACWLVVCKLFIYLFILLDVFLLQFFIFEIFKIW